MPTHSESERNGVFDWDLLVWSRLNAMLCGSRTTVETTVTNLRAHLELPVEEWSFTSELPLPSLQTGTVIVTDVIRATAEQQRAFLEWLNAHHAVRVITLSETPLYDLVQDGAMLEDLYYRLNSIYCALDSNCGSGDLGRISAA